MILTCSLCKIFKSISKLSSNWNSHYLIWNPHYSNWNPHYSNWNLHYSIWNPLLELEFTLLELEILTQDMCKGYTEKTAPVFIQNASSPIRFYTYCQCICFTSFIFEISTSLQILQEKFRLKFSKMFPLQKHHTQVFSSTRMWQDKILQPDFSYN